jgi:hypothetical protein
MLGKVLWLISLWYFVTSLKSICLIVLTCWILKNYYCNGIWAGNSYVPVWQKSLVKTWVYWYHFSDYSSEVLEPQAAAWLAHPLIWPYVDHCWSHCNSGLFCSDSQMNNKLDTWDNEIIIHMSSTVSKYRVGQVKKKWVNIRACMCMCVCVGACAHCHVHVHIH